MRIITYICFRLGSWLSLIFFTGQLISGCKQGNTSIAIYQDDKKPAGFIIPKTLLPDLPDDAIRANLQVRLTNKTELILGTVIVNRGEVLFKPLLPPTPGLLYEIRYGRQIIGTVTMPPVTKGQPPAITAIYPTADTLPENLLKVYLRFSMPMSEGGALDHITVLGENRTPVKDIFLDLQPELWNEDRTVLTLWLDPGRIKRELIPNQKMGKPLQKNRHYTISLAGWKSKEGAAMLQPFEKTFFASARDGQKPKPANWAVQVPAIHSKQPLSLHFNEALDYFLLSETITVIDEQNKPVPGAMVIATNETGLSFAPDTPWQPGNYRVRVASVLEDLAGNNINRLFDRDNQKDQASTDAAFVYIGFAVK